MVLIETLPCLCGTTISAAFVRCLAEHFGCTAVPRLHWKPEGITCDEAIYND